MNIFREISAAECFIASSRLAPTGRERVRRQEKENEKEGEGECPFGTSVGDVFSSATHQNRSG
jgi:hypothetical protein